MDTSERNFEETIEAWLLYQHGYIARHPDNYDRARCLDAEEVISFLQASQPQEWQKLAQVYGRRDAREAFISRLAEEIGKRGVLDVLRAGVKDRGVHLRLAYFVPASGLNPEMERRYRANRFAVIRQLQFEAEGRKSLDMVLFLNGLPLFTVELKNHLTGQDVQDAIRQYRHTRDPREALFTPGRCLAHFAVDNDLVFVSTALAGSETVFLPFNQGKFGGAGNPPRPQGFESAYLWEEIWSPASLLDLVQHFLHTREDDGRGRGRRGQHITFPRYHQLDAVRRLVAHARDHGVGQRYLIQHSAGSGKSNSIAWLAHRLSVLHDESDQRVFHQVVVISDRRVIDRQLQDVVRQFEQTLGLVEAIDESKSSRDLLAALQGGKQIVVTTLQKFPVVLDYMAGQQGASGLAGRRFAVIIDEAHSSQGGESIIALKRALSLEQAAEEEDQEPPSYEDQIIAEMERRRWPGNVSVFAFTATPRARTLELFGWQDETGSFQPFSLYSMRQAIEEGFILDVLAHYSTWRSYFQLVKTIEDDPKYKRSKAMALMRQYVELHPHAIDQKTALMIEHFHEQVAGQINGQARAMLVTRSRLHAVRYMLAFERYLRQQGYPYKALVAFTGTVADGDESYTEAGMNHCPETQTAERFRQDDYRFLIVANKFQTGFDQPLLHTMYVDRKLQGLHAVQTLSRLNRTYPPLKTSTFILDFVNDVETIRAAFAPYYEQTLLTEASDPNLLYDIQRALEGYHFYTAAEVNAFVRVCHDPKAKVDRLHAALRPAVDRWQDAPLDQQKDFRALLRQYEKLYGFLSQVISFADGELEELYVFARFLLRKLPLEREELPREVQENIAIDFYRLQKTGEGQIALPRGAGRLDPDSFAGAAASEDEEAVLSALIRQLNERFGTDFSEADKVFIRDFELRLAQSDTIRRSVEVNPPDHARLTFEQVAMDTLQQMMDVNFSFFRRVNDDAEFAQALLGWLYERYRKAA